MEESASTEIMNQARKDAREIIRHSENEAKRLILVAKADALWRSLNFIQYMGFYSFYAYRYKAGVK